MTMPGPPALGLRHRTVRLLPYDPRWAELYAEEAERIRHAIGQHLVALEHHGSTAVPSLPAKPVLDILGGLRRLEDARLCIEPLLALGYYDAGTDVVPGQHIFGRSVDPHTSGNAVERTHLLHLVEYGSVHWRDNIAFRDALRGDPELARHYAALKQELAARFPEDRPSYSAAKTDFIRKVVAAHSISRNKDKL